MKDSVSNDMALHLAQEVTTTAYLWNVTRADGQVFGFTSHDEPITYAGLTYEASSGFMPSAVATTTGLAVDDLELEGILSSASINQEDLVAGLWDGAEVWLYQVNYADLGQGAIVIRRGWTGEVRSGTVSFVAELRGIAQALAQQIGENYSPSCRASFCDSRCKLTLSNYKVSGTVSTVTSRREFTDAGRAEAPNYFNLGLLTFKTGNNANLSREVKSSNGSAIVCELPFPFDIEAGDTYDLWRGCDKQFSTCKNTYNNIVNFRGEPYVPVADTLVRGPN